MHPTPRTLPLPNDEEASRFLSHATLGYTRADIDRVKTLGYHGWIKEQFDNTKTPKQLAHWNWIDQNRPRDANAGGNARDSHEICDSMWRKFLNGKDLLRQKSLFALTQITVTSIEGMLKNWLQYAAAYYVDQLEDQAFGNYKNVLLNISKTPMMGMYLTFVGSKKAGADGTNNQPDENYARELLQLFSIGVSKLNMDGTPQLDSLGNEIPTYSQNDIKTLARVFTGYDVNKSAGPSLLEQGNKALVNTSKYFDSGAKSMPFINVSISNGTNAANNLTKTIDGIFAHANIAPFIARQLIQRLVTSNPSPQYVRRVAEVFLDDRKAYPDENLTRAGVRGDMKALLRAVLLDKDLFDTANKRSRGAPACTPSFGKLREPVQRFVQWGRVFALTTNSNKWKFKEREVGLGQVPMRSPSVFNFYRPGYIPPATEMAQQNLVAPEFQITHEASVVSYLNFMHQSFQEGVGIRQQDIRDIQPNYSSWITPTMAGNPAALVAELNMVLAAKQVSATTVQQIVAYLNNTPGATPADLTYRVKAAAMMILSSPEYFTLK